MPIVKSKDIVIDKFNGIDNVMEPSETGDGYFQEVENVVITDEQKVRRRDGYSRILASNIHSLWSDGNGLCVFRSSNGLYRLLDDLSTSVLLSSGFNSANKVDYLKVGNRVYYSDNAVNGVIENNAVRTWGIVNPGQPALTTISGDLIEGRYQIVYTYVRSDGQESGSSLSAYADVDGTQGINIGVVASTDSDVQYINVYSTSTSGEVFWKIGSFANQSASVTLVDNNQISGTVCKTMFLSNPPVGQLLCNHNGRIFIANDYVLYYTEPYGYEHIDYSKNYILLPSTITMLGAVQDGLWVATNDQTIFLSGESIPYKQILKDDSGVIQGTSINTSGVKLGSGEYSGPITIWASVKYGLCAGLNGGQLLYLTKDHFVFPASASGSGAILEQNDATQYIVALS